MRLTNPAIRFNLILTALLLVFNIFSASAQQSQVTDSIIQLYNKETSLPEKARLAGELSQIFMAIDTLSSEKWGNQAIEDAEISRDRKAMFKSQLDNGIRMDYIAARTGYSAKALEYMDNALRMAKENKLEKEQAESLLWKAYVYQANSEIDQAMAQTTQALTLAQAVGNDSLLAACYYSFSKSHEAKGEKLQMLKNTFQAVSISEAINNHALLRTGYMQLAQFYTSIKNYDKALDFTFKVLQLDLASNSDESKYGRAQVYNSIAGIYQYKKNYSMAESFFNKSILYADTIKFQPLKMQGYLGLMNLYIVQNDPVKALEFFNAKADLKQYIAGFGMAYVIDQAYAVMYSRLNKLDSASYYYSRCLPYYENSVNPASRLNFYFYYAEYLNQKSDKAGAIAIYEKCKQIADATKSLDWMRVYSKLLDSSYTSVGNYAQALHYNKLYNRYKDSLDKLGKEDEILQLQITDEEKRRDRLAIAEKEKIEKRNRIQYMAIVIAIATIFLLLVLLGLFRVSATTIRIIGFFAFLMFFEFIFLVFKKSIFGITQGEPWKDLGMMILIAAILVPLHHWVEHKVIHYLSSQHMLKLRDNSKAWWNRVSKRGESAA
jgi:tetratricopeptide (TPR) repeat protein